MKRILAVALFFVIFPLSSRADEASKRAKIQEVFDLLHMDKLTQQLMDAAVAQSKTLTSGMIGTSLDASTQQKLDRFQSKILTLVTSQVGWQAMEPQYVDLYANTFTEAQIDDLLAFYKSPTGQVVIEKMPELTRNCMQLAQQKMIAIQPQLKQLIRDFAKEVAPPLAKPPQS